MSVAGTTCPQTEHSRHASIATTRAVPVLPTLTSIPDRLISRSPVMNTSRRMASGTTALLDFPAICALPRFPSPLAPLPVSAFAVCAWRSESLNTPAGRPAWPGGLCQYWHVCYVNPRNLWHIRDSRRKRSTGNKPCVNASGIVNRLPLSRIRLMAVSLRGYAVCQYWHGASNR